MLRNRITRASTLGCSLLALSGCTETPGYATPLGALDSTLATLYGYDRSSGPNIETTVDIQTLLQASQACDAATLKLSDIRISPQSNPPQQTRTTKTDGNKTAITALHPYEAKSVDKGNANCPLIHKTLFFKLADANDLVCDEFIFELYRQQRNLSATSDFTNIAAGVMAAAVGIFSLGSMVGAATGVTASALNLAFDSYASVFLFSIPAGDISKIIYTKKQEIRADVLGGNFETGLTIQQFMQNYYLTCTPAFVQSYVTEAIANNAKLFLDPRRAEAAAIQIANSLIDSTATDISPYVGKAGTLVTPQGVAALYYWLLPDRSAIAGENPDDRKARVEAYLKAAELFDFTNNSFDFNDAEVKRVAEKRWPGLAIDEEKTLAVKTDFAKNVSQSLRGLGLGSATGLPAALNKLLASLPPAPAPAPAPVAAPAAGAAPSIAIEPVPSLERIDPALPTLPGNPAVLVP